jgi:hypothetical protein
MLRVETRGARARKNERARFNYVEILNKFKIAADLLIALKSAI